MARRLVFVSIRPERVYIIPFRFFLNREEFAYVKEKKNCSWRTLFRVTLEFPPPRWFHYFALSFTFQVNFGWSELWLKLTEKHCSD